MASLFIANCSKQDNDFTFLLPESNRHHMRTIPAGGQIELKGISGEASKVIIEHHMTYGLRPIEKAQKDPGFAGLCYSEREIKANNIRGAIEHNIEALNETGRKLRDEASVAADQSLLNNGVEGEVLNKTVVEIRELEGRDRPEPQLNEVREVRPGKGDQEDRRGKHRPRS